MFGWPQRTVIMTCYGEYIPHQMEVDAFRSVYAGEAGANLYEPKWMKELFIYAEAQTKKEFESK